MVFSRHSDGRARSKNINMYATSPQYNVHLPFLWYLVVMIFEVCIVKATAQFWLLKYLSMLEMLGLSYCCLSWFLLGSQWFTLTVECFLGEKNWTSGTYLSITVASLKCLLTCHWPLGGHWKHFFHRNPGVQLGFHKIWLVVDDAGMGGQ